MHFVPKKFFILSLNSLLLILMQCRPPEQIILDRYFKYLKNNQPEKAYQLLSQSDKDTMTLDDYILDTQSSLLSELINRLTVYRISKIQKYNSGTMAKAQVEIRQIDPLKLLKEIPVLTDETLPEKTVNKIFHENLSLIHSFYVNTNLEYKLIMERDQWQIEAGFQRKKQMNELKNQGNALYQDYQYEKAFILLNEALDFDKTNREVIDLIIKIQEKIDYIHRFLKITVQPTSSNHTPFTVTLTVENTGNLLIKKILIDLVLSTENTTIPVNREVEFFNGQINQTGLGYTDRMTKTFTFSDLRPGLQITEAKISGIEF